MFAGGAYTGVDTATRHNIAKHMMQRMAELEERGHTSPVSTDQGGTADSVAVAVSEPAVEAPSDSEAAS